MYESALIGQPANLHSLYILLKPLITIHVKNNSHPIIIIIQKKNSINILLMIIDIDGIHK